MKLCYLKASFYNGTEGQPLSTMSKIRGGYCPIIIAESNDEWASLITSHEYIGTDEASAGWFKTMTGYDVQTLFCPGYFRSATDRGLSEEHAAAFPAPLLVGYPMSYPTGSNILIVIEDDPDHYIVSGTLRDTWVNHPSNYYLYDAGGGSRVGIYGFINACMYADPEINHGAYAYICIAKETESRFTNYGVLSIHRYKRTGSIQASTRNEAALLEIMNGYHPLDPDQIEETVLVPVLWNSSYKPEKYQAFARLKRLISL